MNLSDWATLLGIIFGTAGLVTGSAGLVMGLLNYRRDRAQIIISLQWDAESKRGRGNIVEASWGHIYVTNKGRRPAYVTFVGLEYPDADIVMNLLSDGGNPAGKQLPEGDAPLIIKVPQDGSLQKYKEVGRKYAP